MRSMLFVPGDSERKLAKSLGTGADALILDLEDSVAADRREAAREMSARFVAEHGGNADSPRLWVRINPVQSGLAEADLAAFAVGPPHGIVLPKPRSGADAQAGAALIETAFGADASYEMIAIATEAPIAVLNLASFVAATPRLIGLSWGSEDLSAELGAVTNRDEAGALTSPFQLARDLCLMTAVAGGMQPLDTVYADFRDDDGLRRECAAAARDGFTGKLAIHPGQVTIINAAFTPSEAAIADARRVVDAFANTNTGVASLDGTMLDKPHLIRAERLLARAGKT
ncbi:MAG: CoA ester lyase [Pseudomonadota bacterium]